MIIVNRGIKLLRHKEEKQDEAKGSRRKQEVLSHMHDFALRVITASLGKTYLFSVGQAGYIIKSGSGQLLGIDLYLSDCVERVEGSKGYKRMLPKILGPDELVFDAVVTTHFHKDHFDDDAVPILVSNGAKLYAAHDCKDDIKRLGLEYYSPAYVAPGDKAVCGDFELIFVDCDHGRGAPLAVGVIVKVDGRTIYEAGDTCLRMDRVEALKAYGPFDAVIGPINGAYGNMNEREFPKLAHELGGIAIPCHYGMFPSHGGNPGIFYEEMKKYPEDRFLIMTQGEKYTF